MASMVALCGLLHVEVQGWGWRGCGPAVGGIAVVEVKRQGWQVDGGNL